MSVMFLAMPPSGPAYEFEEEALRKAYAKGERGITDDWLARRVDSNQWSRIRVALGVDPESGTPPYSEAPTASFACFQCRGSLRIRLPSSEANYRCPKCRAEFEITKACNSPLVYLVVPDKSQFTSRASEASMRRKREFSKEALIALALFGLEEVATFDQVRSAYRELVKSYHPDKVAHLGPDLRRVAEAKTKEINSAYSVLETFYAT